MLDSDHGEGLGDDDESLLDEDYDYEFDEATHSVKLRCSNQKFTLGDACRSFANKTATLVTYFCSKVWDEDGVRDFNVNIGGYLFDIFVIPNALAMKKKEILAARKQLLTKRMLGQVPFVVEGFQSNRPASYKKAIYLPYQDKPQALVLRNELSLRAVVGMLLIAVIHIQVSLGWQGGCQASGPLTLQNIFHALNMGRPFRGWGFLRYYFPLLWVQVDALTAINKA